MDPKLVITNGRLVFALITVIGAALITLRVSPVELYSTLRFYLTGMVILGIGLDIFGRLKLTAFHSTDNDHN